MKLNEKELRGLRQMIVKTSAKVLEKYKNDSLNKKYDYLFIGDSIIEYFNLNLYLPNILAINRGVAGATTKFIIDNLEAITGNIEPNVIFISIGSNDLVLLESTVDEVYLGVIEVFNILKAKFPKVKINYLSTTPVVSTTNVLYKKLYIGGRTNEELKSINNKVKMYSTINDIYYVDMFNELLGGEGYLDSRYTPDGIHLNQKGYEIYSSIIKNNIE